MDNIKHTKIAYLGGMKSGKSNLAEKHTLLLAKDKKPIYIACAKAIDKEMQKRIDTHKEKRQDKFITIEEPIDIEKHVKQAQVPILIESISMWLNNMLFLKKGAEEILTKAQNILREKEKTIVFVQDIVGLGIIPDNILARQFIDISGELDLLLGKYCDEVYLSFAGCPIKIK